jgi:hypothetical protein
MEDRNLQELCYRVIQELRHYSGEEVESFEGRLEQGSYSWRFRSQGSYYNPRIAEMRISMDELYGRFRVNLPSIVERMEVYWDRRERLPSIRLYDRYGQPVHIATRRPLSAIMQGADYMMVAPQITQEPKGWDHYQMAAMYGMSVIKEGGRINVGVDTACSPPKEKSRKELLAESRPTRLARLWKDMYAKTGKKPLSIKQLAIT